MKTHSIAHLIRLSGHFPPEAMKLRLEARVSSDSPDAVPASWLASLAPRRLRAKVTTGLFAHRGLVPVVLRYGVCLAERGNWQNVMGATLSALSEKEKGKSRKRKAPFENKKTRRKRLPPAGDMSNFARADRTMSIFDPDGV